MHHVNLTAAADAKFQERLAKASGQDVKQCYQCGKCTAGCPIAYAMDEPPNRIMRMLQLGLKDEVLDSKAIWLCSTCATCTTRCPKNIDVAGVMDSLRVMAKQEGRTRALRSIDLFNDIFLGSVRKYGRVYEFGVGMGHNLRMGKLLKDVDIGTGLMTKGRMKLFPSKIKGQGEIARIFNEVYKLEEAE
ncbi:MAG: 4Fe-4S dicluster domain-containing protein [Clostridia bacterium]|nr:4Fe-4S dicluster domain-containing protein [Clostridia bacterium]MDQ7791178.1 4Fe-4S dicluster domain-containing protein [Clostridia bacterium]